MEIQKWGSFKADHFLYGFRRAFITFANPESADRAVGEMHGKNINGITLQVQLTHRQPQIEPTNDASSSSGCTSIASSNSQKGRENNRREIVHEENDEDFYCNKV